MTVQTINYIAPKNRNQSSASPTRRFPCRLSPAWGVVYSAASDQAGGRRSGVGTESLEPGILKKRL